MEYFADIHDDIRLYIVQPGPVRSLRHYLPKNDCRMIAIYKRLLTIK